MNETVGTLSLKIARLEQYLKVLRQQQKLSRGYPEHLANLRQRGEQVQHHLYQLIISMENMLNSSEIGATK